MIKGITFGAFDLCHTGHLLMFEEIKKHCDYLIVGLHINPQVERPHKNKPIESEYERWVRLHACRYVDEIVPYNTEEELCNILRQYKPDLRFLGDEYIDKDFKGRDICKNFFLERKHSYSSTNLRNKIKESI